jgi:hypothetical protein
MHILKKVQLVVLLFLCNHLSFTMDRNPRLPQKNDYKNGTLDISSSTVKEFVYKSSNSTDCWKLAHLYIKTGTVTYDLLNNTSISYHSDGTVSYVCSE